MGLWWIEIAFKFRLFCWLPPPTWIQCHTWVESNGGRYFLFLFFSSHVWFFVIPWATSCQALLSMEFSRQEYWSGLWFPPPGDLPDPGIEPVSLASPALAGSFFTNYATWQALLCMLNRSQLLFYDSKLFHRRRREKWTPACCLSFTWLCLMSSAGAPYEFLYKVEIPVVWAERETKVLAKNARLQSRNDGYQGQVSPWPFLVSHRPF